MQATDDPARDSHNRETDTAARNDRAEQRVVLDIPGLDVDFYLYLHDERDQYVSATLRKNRIWEPFETSLLLASLEPGDTFIDVGANIGYFSVLAAQRVGPSGQVFAFEPDADNCGLLHRSVVANVQQNVVQIVEAALADADGEGALYLSEDNLGDHQVYAAQDTRRAHRAITLLNGSRYLKARCEAVALLKIDTQGSEFCVVQGLMDHLYRYRQGLRVLIELTPHSLRAAGATGRELIALLATLELPFWIVDHIEHELVPTTQDALSLWCDNVDSVPGDEGFMNIFLGQNPF